LAFEILRDLRGLKIEVIHAPDAEGLSLVEHLDRIGCKVTTVWPIPEGISRGVDMALLAIDHDSRDRLRQIIRSQNVPLPTILAIVGYENPSTLQLVLEIGAHGVIERPVKPFGLLTQLAVARRLWLHQQLASQRQAKLERRLGGIQKVQRARLILMATHGMTEEQAYQTIRRQAMGKRIGMEEMASAIIQANELVNLKRGSE
jgi:AmiR/NasT family two-component response regulator